MLRIRIYRCADHCLFAWKATRAGSHVVFYARTKRGQPPASRYVDLVDPMLTLVPNGNAEVWVSPSEHVNPDRGNERDCTRKVLQLMLQRPDQRNVPPLRMEQQALCPKLVTRGEQP